MRCYVCGRETPPRQRYCDRCRLFFMAGYDNAKRRAALIAAYDKARDGFLCNWSGVLLEERDHADPFHLCFDHRIPVETSELVVSSELFNRMKTDLAPDEFQTAFEELAAHHNGRPFNRSAIKFAYWRRRSPHPPEPNKCLYREELSRVRVDACVVCGGPPWQESIYCERCRKFVFWRGYDRAQHARAMKEAWNADEGRFICQYTGAAVDDGDPTSPWYLSFDHGIPGDPKSIIVAASWVNSMKNALSKEEFWKVVGEYDRYLLEGGEFDRDIVEFKYWKRARRTSG